MPRHRIAKIENIGKGTELTSVLPLSLPRSQIESYSNICKELGVNRSRLFRIILTMIEDEKNDIRKKLIKELE